MPSEGKYRGRKVLKSIYNIRGNCFVGQSVAGEGAEVDGTSTGGGVEPSTQPNTRWRGPNYNVPTSFGAPKASGNKKNRGIRKKKQINYGGFKKITYICRS